MTEKVFLDKLIKDIKNRAEGKKFKLLLNVKTILLDEVHERNMTIDLIMGIMQDTVKAYKFLKVVICSATVNEELFQNYLN